MAAEHFGIVHFINVVAGQHRHILRIVQIHEADVLVDGVGGALIPSRAAVALVRGEDMHAAVHAVKLPRLAAADVAVQLQRAVLGEHAHGVYAGVCTVGEGEINDAELPPERDGGLGHVSGEHIEAAALTAGQQHGNAFFFHG